MVERQRLRPTALVGALCVLLFVAPGSAAPVQETGQELWVDRYDPDEGNAFGLEVLVAPDGATVYSIGVTTIGDDESFYRVAALDSATGEQRWVAERPGNTHAAVLSPDGARIYIAGTVRTDDVTRQDWSIRALDSTDGTELWSTAYLQRGRRDAPADIEVAPDNQRVYVTGQSLKKRRNSRDFTTLSLDAASGDKEWVDRYDAAGGYDEPVDLAVDPAGTRVFVTGFSTWPDSAADYTTVAYEAATGGRLWRAPPGLIGKSNDYPVAVVTDGDQVYVTGQTTPANGDPDWLTFAYYASEGDIVWAAAYDRKPGADEHDHAYGMALSPRGRRLYVVGDSTTAHNDAVTISYRTDDGDVDWVSRFDGPEGKNDLGWDVVASPDRRHVYVTGESVGTKPNSPDFVTLRHSAHDGTLEWSARYEGPNESMDQLPTLAVHPDSHLVFVTGREWSFGNVAATTLAYEPPD